MNSRRDNKCLSTTLSLCDSLRVSIDYTLDSVYKYFELPLQSAFRFIGHVTLCYFRSRLLIDFSRQLTQLLFQSYAITFSLYFFVLLLGHAFTLATQRHYFIDPLLSNDRQCVNIKFTRVINNRHDFDNILLKENFLRENSIVKDEIVHRKIYNYTQLHHLLHLLEDNSYMICQRSLYLYARFHNYASLLHSNHSQFQFVLSDYPSSFAIDQPPFIDLCIHASNRSHLNEIKSQILPLSSYSYPSMNLFLFDFNFTQVSLTLYELNSQSKHLERVSVQTGWLFDLYSQFYFFKYNLALSTVLFDGLSAKHQYVDYFDYPFFPVPVDPLLALNEMVQQTPAILPLC